MSFIVLIYQPAGFDPKTLPADAHAAIAADYGRLSALPHVKPWPPLGRYQEALEVRDGATRALPPSARGEVVTAVWTVEVETAEDALALAAEVPAVRLGGSVEVRPAGAYW
jgi:hypothetical protein